MTSSSELVIPPPPVWPEPLRLGSLTLASRFTLAPLAGYTNWPFRLCVRERGGLGLATTDLVNARAILLGSRKTLELLAMHPDDRPLAVQLYGTDATELIDAGRWVLDHREAACIDLNMGCPVRKVVRTGGGSALMCEVISATRLVERLVSALPVPVTVKMRLGWDAEHLTAPTLAREFEKVGVAAITVHGRTRAQGFSGSVNRDGIRAVVEAVERVPILGNGDVRTIADAAAMFADTGCAGIAIGRGALLNPWLFQQLDAWVRSGQPGPSGGYLERLALMERHVRRLCEWRDEHYGCLQFRKVANWYCRALRTGKAIQSVLIRLDSLATLERVIRQLRDQGPPPGWRPPGATETAIPVPAGPIAHW